MAKYAGRVVVSCTLGTAATSALQDGPVRIRLTVTFRIASDSHVVTRRVVVLPRASASGASGITG